MTYEQLHAVNLEAKFIEIQFALICQRDRAVITRLSACTTVPMHACVPLTDTLPLRPLQTERFGAFRRRGRRRNFEQCAKVRLELRQRRFQEHFRPRKRLHLQTPSQAARVCSCSMLFSSGQLTHLIGTGPPECDQRKRNLDQLNT